MMARDQLVQRNGHDPDAVVVPREVLSWASVVLYGDPDWHSSSRACGRIARSTP